MSYFGTLTAPQKTGVKPHKVSLYETRDIIDPSTNAAHALDINPGADAAGMAATTAATQAGRPVSPLMGQLESQASNDLALGGQLSPDEIRQAVQGERAAWSSRGLVKSAPAAFSEVLGRIQFSNQRKAERRGFAASVVGLDNQQRGVFGSLLENASASRLGSYGMAEQMRQDEISRSDSLKTKDKTLAVNLKTGQANADAGASAGKAQAVGSAVAGVAVAAAIF